MDIKSITIENFRCHELFKLELGKVTLVTGKNGSGKSSLIEAVATVLLGENTWTVRSGVRLPDFIRAHEHQATVSITGKRTISRIITEKGSRLVLDGTDALTQPLLLNNMRVTEAQLRAALIPQSFLNLKLKDQKETLFNLLSKKLTMEEVDKHVPASATWSKLKIRWAEETEDYETVDLDKLYDFCFEARRNYKSTQAPVSKPAAPKSEDMVKKLSKLSTEIANGNLQNKRIAAYKEQQKLLPKKREQLAKLKADTAKVQKGAPVEDLEALEAKLDDLNRKEAAAQALHEQASRDQKQAGGIKLAKGKVQCPIGLACPHDEAAVKKTAKHHATRIENLNSELTLLKGEILKAEEEIEKAKVYDRNKEESDQHVEELEDEIKAIAEQDDPGEAVDVEQLKADKAKLEKDITAATKAPTAGAAADDPAVGHLNDIVKALDVNGIKTALVKREIEALEAEINEALAHFGNWRIRFFMDGEYHPAILKSKGELGIGELSDGELSILSLIVQDVFSQRSNIQLVVVDNLDLLDRKNVVEFFDVASKINSKVLVAMAQSELLETMPLPPAVKVVNLSPDEPKRAAAQETPKPRAPKKREEDLL